MLGLYRIAMPSTGWPGPLQADVCRNATIKQIVKQVGRQGTYHEYTEKKEYLLWSKFQSSMSHFNPLSND